MPDTEPTEAGTPAKMETMDAETARRVERERMTRRASLRKLGFGAGMAAFSLLGVDDFARMVGKRMERMAGDNKVAGQVAKEFQQAGIALADGPSWAGCDTCTDLCVAPKYFKCTPCIPPCSGETPTGKDNCSKYTVGTNKQDCEVCCGIQWPVDNLLGLASWKICIGLC